MTSSSAEEYSYRLIQEGIDMDISQRLSALKERQLKLEAQLAENQAKETQVAGEALALLIQRNPRIHGALCQLELLSLFSSPKRKLLEKWLERNAPSTAHLEAVPAHPTDGVDTGEPAHFNNDRPVDTE